MQTSMNVARTTPACARMALSTRWNGPHSAGLHKTRKIVPCKVAARGVRAAAKETCLAYEIAGPRRADTPITPPPTAVLLHGILGNRRNLASLTRRLVGAFPNWQILAIDLRCHGESRQLGCRGNNTVQGAAEDVEQLFRQLGVAPRAVVGHSFGGRVALALAQRAVEAAPLQKLSSSMDIWALDVLPAECMHGELQTRTNARFGGPKQLIDAMRNIRMPVASRSEATQQICDAGFPPDVAAWAGSSLQVCSAPADSSEAIGQRSYASSSQLTWALDLCGVQELYSSFETTDLWPFVDWAGSVENLSIHFLEAEQTHRPWTSAERSRLRLAGHRVWLLERAGHWVHVDNPTGLVKVLSTSFAPPETSWDQNAPLAMEPLAAAI